MTAAATRGDRDAGARSRSRCPWSPVPIRSRILIQEGHHRDALAACVRTHGAVLGRLCMALLGSQADADEATQETLLRAHRGDGDVPRRGHGQGVAVRHRAPRLRAHARDAAHAVASCSRSCPPRRRGARRVRAPPARARAARCARRSSSRASARRWSCASSPTSAIARSRTACNLDEAAARKRISRALAHALRSVDARTEEIESMRTDCEHVHRRARRRSSPATPTRSRATPITSRAATTAATRATRRPSSPSCSRGAGADHVAPPTISSSACSPRRSARADRRAVAPSPAATLPACPRWPRPPRRQRRAGAAHALAAATAPATARRAGEAPSPRRAAAAAAARAARSPRPRTLARVARRRCGRGARRRRHRHLRSHAQRPATSTTATAPTSERPDRHARDDRARRGRPRRRHLRSATATGWRPLRTDEALPAGAELRTDERTRAVARARRRHAARPRSPHRARVRRRASRASITLDRRPPRRRRRARRRSGPASITTPTGAIDVVGTRFSVTATDALTVGAGRARRGRAHRRRAASTTRSAPARRA